VIIELADAAADLGHNADDLVPVAAAAAAKLSLLATFNLADAAAKLNCNVHNVMSAAAAAADTALDRDALQQHGNPSLELI
jgi:hypothetical protein